MKPEAYKEFAEIYAQEFGEKLSQLETRLKADQLIRLYKKIVLHNQTNKEKINE